MLEKFQERKRIEHTFIKNQLTVGQFWNDERSTAKIPRDKSAIEPTKGIPKLCADEKPKEVRSLSNKTPKKSSEIR